MTVLADADIEAFAVDGYVLVPGLVAESDLVRIDAEVDRLIAAGPPPEGHAGPHFYWPSADDSPALFAPLHRPEGVLAAAGELTAPGRIGVAFDNAQVALNIPPFNHRPGAIISTVTGPIGTCPPPSPCWPGSWSTTRPKRTPAISGSGPARTAPTPPISPNGGRPSSTGPAGTPISSAPSRSRSAVGGGTSCSLTTSSVTTSGATTPAPGPGAP